MHSASFTKQATLYGIVLAVIAALVVGFIILAGQLDQPPDEFADRAPWAQPGADQSEPSPLQ